MTEPNTSTNNRDLEKQKTFSKFFVKVYLWMTGLLGITAIISVWAYNLGIVTWFHKHPGIFCVFLAGELALLMAAGWLQEKLSFSWLVGLVMTYVLLNGFTLSVLLKIHKPTTVAVGFLGASAVFCASSVYGAVTNKSVQGWSRNLLMGLVGLLVVLVMNLFMGSGLFDWMISCAAIVLFVCLSIYDAQKINRMAEQDQTDAQALTAALTLYLDFLNLFIHLLRLMDGKPSSKSK